jgi:hypothetical protein
VHRQQCLQNSLPLIASNKVGQQLPTMTRKRAETSLNESTRHRENSYSKSKHSAGLEETTVRDSLALECDGNRSQLALTIQTHFWCRAMNDRHLGSDKTACNSIPSNQNNKAPRNAPQWYLLLSLSGMCCRNPKLNYDGVKLFPHHRHPSMCLCRLRVQALAEKRERERERQWCGSSTHVWVTKIEFLGTERSGRNITLSSAYAAARRVSFDVRSSS